MRTQTLAATFLPLLALAVVGCGADIGSRATDDGSFGTGRPATTTTIGDPNDAVTPATVSPGTVTPAPAPAPLAEPSVVLREVGSFDRPVAVAAARQRLYVAEQAGRVLAISPASSGVPSESTTEVVLDITDLTEAGGERGLLGLAFHPETALAYVDFTDLAGNTTIAEFAFDPTSGVLARDSYREVLTIDQPYSGHNGGQLAFGPDQMLYIGLGDGGGSGDPDRRALDLASPLGKILRIDPRANGDAAFTIPADNPFVEVAGADATIWSYGLRNPWRFSFDPDTGDLWIADVGRGDFEEVNQLQAADRSSAGKGANLGWSAIEGFEPVNTDQSPADSVQPVFVYDHSAGRCSISGGAVARGVNAASLAGWYVFGDFCTGQIWALDPTIDASEPRVIEIGQLDSLVAVAYGPNDDLYAVSLDGTVARLDAS